MLVELVTALLSEDCLVDTALLVTGAGEIVHSYGLSVSPSQVSVMHPTIVYPGSETKTNICGTAALV